MTLIFASRAIGLTASTSAASSGPMNSCAPSDIADFAALAAPSAVPAVSRGTRVSRSASVVNSASCAASSIAWPSSALAPDSGSSSATLTAGPAAPLGAGGGGSGFAATGDCAGPTGAGTIRPPPQAASAPTSPKANNFEANRGSRQRSTDALRPGCNRGRRP